MWKHLTTELSFLRTLTGLKLGLYCLTTMKHSVSCWNICGNDNRNHFCTLALPMLSSPNNTINTKLFATEMLARVQELRVNHFDRFTCNFFSLNFHTGWDFSLGRLKDWNLIKASSFGTQALFLLPGSANGEQFSLLMESLVPRQTSGVKTATTST